uniref:Neur_chan_LBD domain-containing protein n=1 Tax=Heterorhabditis bacteriophora TaxID=37862 RepID=A0A1I7W8R9_HETBA
MISNCDGIQRIMVSCFQKIRSYFPCNYIIISAIWRLIYQEGDVHFRPQHQQVKDFSQEIYQISTYHVIEYGYQTSCFSTSSADGNYEVSFRSNAFVEYTGDVLWVPPAMFKSSCRIDVEWFPFDEQSCTLVFGSWTYNSDEVLLNWYKNVEAVQLTDYSYSGIWDVIGNNLPTTCRPPVKSLVQVHVPGYLINKKETKESKIVFHVVIRR